MEATGLALSAAQTLLAALQCSLVEEMVSKVGYQSELENLVETISDIKSVLQDVESKDEQEVSHYARDSIRKLKDAVYDVDDLFDEFATRAQQQQVEEDPNLVSSFFSCYQELDVSCSLSREVKNVRRWLDEISISTNVNANRRVRAETYSYVEESSIVGREDDRRKIVDMLLDPNMKGDDVILSIVGMGGLGKTTVAQLVYNDPRIQNEFTHHRRFWVCVSDYDQKETNERAILTKILKSIAGETCVDDLAFDDIVGRLRNKLDEVDKFLLVLDDLWAEDRVLCKDLMNILIGSDQKEKRGSRIVVTTRSKETASAVGSNHLYGLDGLSNENSWCLFEMKVGREQANRHDLVEMGKDIVKKCANVPLAIKVVGSLLHGQDENRWRSFQQCRVTAINEIMSVLNFSYYHLSPSLKNCFTYCALFPEDVEIQKEKIISLWIAHDYVEPCQGQSIEEAAEDHFQILVQKCLFQDVKEHQLYGKAFNIHGLIHDMAQQIAGEEFSVQNFATSNPDEKIRHLYDQALSSSTTGFMTKSKIRTYVGPPHLGVVTSIYRFPVSTLLGNWRRLRALDLCSLDIRSLPDSIGELLHLRYLDLYGNPWLIELPKSLTKLINLQYLNLDRCSNLEELPEDFRKLVNLRTLYVHNLDDVLLRYMPLGIENLTCLSRLNRFVVGRTKSILEQDVGDRLEGLRVPGNLRGSLQIWIADNYMHVKENGGQGGLLCNTKHLKSISIGWPSACDKEEGEIHCDEDLLEDLQPQSELEELTVEGYHGVRIPSWGREDNLAINLPKLVKVVLKSCNGLQELPWLGRLRFLKTLRLEELKNLEYMENRTNDVGTVRAVEMADSLEFLPALEELELVWLPKLKGWWRGSCTSNSDNGHRFMSFPQLSRLTIWDCPNLTSIPLCPSVETVELRDISSLLPIIIEKVDQKEVGCTCSVDFNESLPKMRSVKTDNVRYLKSLPTGALQCVTKMKISFDHKVENLLEVAEVFKACSSSLRSLKIVGCDNLRSVSRGLECLNVLDSLKLSWLSELTFDESEDEEEQWRCLNKCLRSLDLCRLKKVVHLPKGMRYLTALQSLTITLDDLRDLPEWIGYLSSLQSLHISPCKHLESLPEALQKLTSLKRLVLSLCKRVLEERCQEPNGEDWPKIRHIPVRDIWCYYD